MEILVGVQPTTHHAHHVPAAAGDGLVRPAEPSAHLPATLEAQAAAETARARHAELERLYGQMADLTDALVALAADPLVDPHALVDRQAEIDALHAEMEQLQARIDLAVLRADHADRALLEAGAELEASAANANVASDSHRDMFQRMADAIQGVQDGFVRETQVAAQQILEFLRGYADIMAKLGTAIKADTAKDKEGYVIVTFNDLRAELATFIDEWEDRTLGRFDSEADARRFLTDSGLIEMDFPIRQANREWVIEMPDHVAEATRTSMPPNGNPEISWNNAQYQAWLSGTNGRQEGLQNNSRTIVERLSRVNQIFDNLNQVLSEALRAINDVDKQFAQSL